MSTVWWRLIRLLARLIVRVYYGSFRTTGVEQVPAEGPALFVVNHPNSLLDAAALLVALPRPVSFAAKHTLFKTPLLGWLLRKLGAVPIYRPRDVGGMGRKNLQMFRAYSEHLEKGGAGVIFPEGFSHEDPELKEVKSGPARILLGAEEAAEFKLGVQVVPVGLQFEPKQQFRGDVTVRVGRPFSITDLKGTPRREAIRTIQARIGESLRPLIFHLDRVDLEPLVRRVAEIYDEHQRGISGAVRPRPRSEILRIAGACLNHYLVTDPATVEDVRKKVRVYDRLARRAGITPEILESKRRPVRSFLLFLTLLVRLVVGFPLFAWGCVTSYVPYRLTDEWARTWERREGSVVLPLYRVLVGVPVFAVFWGIECLLVLQWSRSWSITGAFLVSLAVCGLYARIYGTHLEVWRDRFYALLPLFLSRRAVRRVARAREVVLAPLSELAHRYSEEADDQLLPPRRKKLRYRIPWKSALAALLIGGLIWFLWGLRDREVEELAGASATFKSLPSAAAEIRLNKDARALRDILQSLGALEASMQGLRRDFGRGDRTYYSPKDNLAIRRVFLSYLQHRARLFKFATFYRDAEKAEAFLLAYAAAVELCARGMQFVATFAGDDLAQARLNEGDERARIPPGMYDRIRRNLANTDVLDLLAAAASRFQSLRDAEQFPASEPWREIVAKAQTGAKTVEVLSDNLLKYKFAAALAKAKRTGAEGRYVIQSIVSTWMGDIRIRARPHGRGLLSPEQLEEIRTLLKPGDIVIERRNWYLSNAFLPGFWPHSALYLGGESGLRSLGLDPVEALEERDHEGHERVMIEALSEGVIFSSLEESVGGADAVCVLRPRLAQADMARAVARALSHHGKPYDFDFDFFSNDRLVCTEVVYQAYEDLIDFELVEIMGRRTLPAVEIVRKWEQERGRPDAELKLIAFYDMDEEYGVARAAGPETLRETLHRTSVAFLQTQEGAPAFLGPGFYLLIAVFLAGLLVLRPRR